MPAACDELGDVGHAREVAWVATHEQGFDALAQPSGAAVHRIMSQADDVGLCIVLQQQDTL